MLTPQELLSEVSELSEKIAFHRLNAEVTFKCLEDEDVMIKFTHYDVRYKNSSSSIYLYTFTNPHQKQAFYYQIDKLFETGGLMDESI